MCLYAVEMVEQLRQTPWKRVRMFVRCKDMIYKMIIFFTMEDTYITCTQAYTFSTLDTIQLQF